MIDFRYTMLRSNAPGTILLLVVLTVVLLFSAACGGGQSQTPKPSGTVPLNPSLIGTAKPAPTAGFSSTLQPPTKSGPSSTLTQPQSTPVQSTGPVSFSRDLQPVIKQQCGVCHVDQSMGGLSLKDYGSLMKGGQRGPAVETGKPDSSLLIRKLRGDAAAGARMPPSGQPLPDATIKLFADWISQGAPNN